MNAGIPRGLNWRRLKQFCALLLTGASLGTWGCAATPAPAPKVSSQWPTLPLKAVPDYMVGTIDERVRLSNTDPFPAGGYSVVVNLHGTGDGSAPTAIREYIKKQMLIHGVDSVMNGKMVGLSPEEILQDKRVSIVKVQGMLPVGAHAGQQFDIIVSAMEGNHTTSLAHGQLWGTDLGENGLQYPGSIGARILARVTAGEVFVNPAYALTDTGPDMATLKASLRTGIVMNGGIVAMDRPIYIQLRQPQVSTARLIEDVIRQRWQNDNVAKAEDEGVVEAYVPEQYGSDWQHFAGVMTHLYLNTNQGYLVNKAKQLVIAAKQKDAKLADISYCWEAIGPDALPVFSPLMTDPDPDVAFAAARAAAFIGDVSAKQALLNMSQDSSNPNQLAAVLTLAGLSNSPEVNHMLRGLLDADSADVRIAAYQILARNGEGVFSKQVGDRFFMDIVQSAGNPMAWASRTGVPRIAMFGRRLALSTPITFTTMDSRLMISSNSDNDQLNIFYRDPRQSKPISVMSRNDLPEIIARLGGEGPADDEAFDFSYNDVVAIVQELVAKKLVVGKSLEGKQLAAAFVLEHSPVDANPLASVAKESPGGRPAGHQAEAMSPSANLNPAPASRPSDGADVTGPHARGD